MGHSAATRHGFQSENSAGERARVYLEHAETMIENGVESNDFANIFNCQDQAIVLTAIDHGDRHLLTLDDAAPIRIREVPSQRYS